MMVIDPLALAAQTAVQQRLARQLAVVERTVVRVSAAVERDGAASREQPARQHGQARPAASAEPEGRAAEPVSRPRPSSMGQPRTAASGRANLEDAGRTGAWPTVRAASEAPPIDEPAAPAAPAHVPAAPRDPWSAPMQPKLRAPITRGEPSASDVPTRPPSPDQPAPGSIRAPHASQEHGLHTGGDVAGDPADRGSATFTSQQGPATHASAPVASRSPDASGSDVADGKREPGWSEPLRPVEGHARPANFVDTSGDVTSPIHASLDPLDPAPRRRAASDASFKPAALRSDAAAHPRGPANQSLRSAPAHAGAGGEPAARRWSAAPADASLDDELDELARLEERMADVLERVLVEMGVEP